MSAATTQPAGPAGMAAEQFVAHLDAKLGARFADIEHSALSQLLEQPETSTELLATFIKYYLLEVFSFGPHVTEATFTAIGRLPKNRPDLMKPMILHDLEEVDHGEMALRDYLTLGGDEAFARSRKLSPESFAMAATCRMLAERESPFAYLGYMYFFEALTPRLAERAQQLLAAKGFPARAQHFIDFHATEDVTHAQGLRNLIIRVVTDFPEAAEAIDHGFDCFAAVYPLPVWAAALRHAKEELDRKRTFTSQRPAGS
jgi:pyrroloquinoline quinone (PQQ) biosynthesis protein C